MDPLSITASILAILGAGGKVGDGLKKIIALKDAPDALLALNNEINDIQIAVEDIGDLLRRCNVSDVTRSPPSTVIRSLERTESTILELEGFIAYNLTTIEAGRPRLDKSKWLRSTQKIQDLKTRLQSDKAAVSLSLGVLAL